MTRLRRYIASTVSASILMVLLVILGFDAIADIIDETESLGGNYDFLAALRFVALSIPGNIFELLPFAAHHHKFAGTGQLAKPDETADQCGERNKFIAAPGKGQGDVEGHLADGIGLGYVLRFIDEGRNGIQSHDDGQHQADGDQHGFTDIEIKPLHAGISGISPGAVCPDPVAGPSL